MAAAHPPVHPGEVLLEEFLRPLAISQYRLAQAIDVPPRRINEIVHGKRAISPVSVLRRTSAIRVPSGEILNAVTLLPRPNTAASTSIRCFSVAIHMRCRPPWRPMTQISSYLVNCGLSRSVTPLSNVLGSPDMIGARRSVVRRSVVTARSLSVIDT